MSIRAKTMRRTLSTESVGSCFSVASSGSDDSAQGDQGLKILMTEGKALLAIAKKKQLHKEQMEKKLKAEMELKRFDEELSTLREGLKSKIFICQAISKVLEANCCIDQTKKMLENLDCRSNYHAQLLMEVKNCLSQLANCVVFEDVDFDENEIRDVLEEFFAKDQCPDLSREIEVANQVEEVSAILERFISGIERYEQLLKEIEHTIHLSRVMQVSIFVALDGSLGR